ncbi:SusD/RagB family nutrient-binding outer membrane lipoprotein [Snuella sedimenti]|uniref:SusD/RagB family nutrient-binding outer membrane lipoprotein n=1 Tax=Snuella sedimenti TaxID=2798802 RepID=A0A8J7LR65_9FLAO|nr:SusD/RagB family nutrient-binding outer membrane lipoprotein [Snuella sedimenti]MBJ6366855.1 SusD/RagB family nutrient-binding outer membrane lipoprotein [Snuella sedimenti]
MKTQNIKLIPICFLLLALAMGCETTNLDLLNDPSELTPVSADPDLLLNNAQLRFVAAIAYNEDNEDGLNVRAAETVRMQHLFGNYSGPFAASNGALNDAWKDLYRETLQDINVLLPIAEERDLQGHIGIAKIIKAFAFVTLVDIWGDVPYSEALQGSAVIAPNVEDGQVIYNDMLVVLDEAIAALNNASIMPADDLFYAGDASKWITAARTLKFKMYAQMRLIGNFQSEINTLISQGIIDDASEDLEFKYSTVSSATGESRHPYYALCYDSDGADDFMNNYYMYLLKDDKGFNDPRLRYYFYRQTPTAPEGDFLDCEGDAVINFCYIGDFYWGRDHGYDAGVDPDQLLRTTYGLYPVGGAYDGDDFKPVTNNVGAGGAGIFPFMLSSYVKFLMAESALTIGTTGNPRTLLEEGIRASMDKVANFQSSAITASLSNILIPDDPDTEDVNEEVTVGDRPEEYLITTDNVNNYVDYVLDAYDAATSDEERLDIIMKEYYIALWGNGIEAYNMYRRTSMPSDMSDPVIEAGSFMRSFLYPAAESATNPNIPEKPVTTKVFWDTNPDNLK